MECELAQGWHTNFILLLKLHMRLCRFCLLGKEHAPDDVHDAICRFVIRSDDF